MPQNPETQSGETVPLSVVGVQPMVPSGACPLPVNWAVAEPPGLALTVKDPVFAPSVPGWNVTVTVQESPAPNMPVHPFCVRAKSRGFVGATATVGAPAATPPVFVITKLRVGNGPAVDVSVN